MFRKGDKVVVIGVGRSGLATAEVLRARGIRVTAYDDKPLQLLSPQTRGALERLRVTLVGPSELEAAVEASKGAIVSPGVPLTHRAVARVHDAGRPVISEIELAYSLARAPSLRSRAAKASRPPPHLSGICCAAHIWPRASVAISATPLCERRQMRPAMSGSSPR